MFLRKHLPASLAAAAFALVACNSPDQAVSPEAAPESRSIEFAKDMTALKAQGLPEAEREQAIRALVARYGKTPSYVPPALGEESETETSADPLAKSAAIPVISWKTVKTTTFDFPFVLRRIASIPAGGTLTASTAISAGAPTTDPFLLAYYQTSGAAGDRAHQIKVVGYSDDISGANLNGSFSWTNNTGSSKQVTVICFAFSPETGGPMKLTTTRPLVGGGTITETTALQNVTGIAKYNDEAGPFPCVGPNGSRVTLSKVSGTTDFNHTVVAVNASNLTGATIRAANTTQEVGSAIASGYANLFLVFVPWANVEGDDVTRFTARQQNKYTCNQ